MASEAVRPAGPDFEAEPGEVYYQRAPITEALIEIRIAPLAESALSAVEGLSRQVADEYPKRRDRFELRGQIEVGARLATQAAQRKTGYDFVSEDERQVFQARLDGFAFSRLKPYQTWRVFRAEAQRLWDVYAGALGPERLTRIGVRFINRVEVPLPFEDFGQYLRLAPDVPAGLPQALSQFLIRFEIPDDATDALIVINETILPPDEPSILPILLDIDVFRSLDVAMSEFDIWSALDELRGRKNEVFEASITDALRELIR